MSTYLKPQSPLYHKDEDVYFYPLTTADQVIMEDGSRLNTILKSTVRKTATLLAVNWSASAPYTQTVTFSDVNFDDLKVDVHVAYTGNKESDLELNKGYSCVSYVKKDGNSITFSCLKDKPATDMPVEIVGTSCDNIANVTVEEGGGNPVLQDKSVAPLTSPQSIVADEGYDGLGVVNIAAMPVKEQAIPSISVDSNGLITASATQSEGYVVAGTKTGTKQLSVKSSNDLTASGATVTVPAGYYPSQSTKSVATATQATPGISINSSGLITASATQSAGYVSSGTKSATKQLTTKAAATITPGTSNKTIAAGTYLTGTQTIAGDADLVATNIKKGANIFGVAGSYEGVELNFDVKAYSSEATLLAATPAANTIGVITTTAITRWDFSATNPFDLYSTLAISATHGYDNNYVKITIVDESNNSTIVSQSVTGTTYYSVFTDKVISFTTADGLAGKLTCSVRQSATPFFTGTVVVNGITIGTISFGSGSNSSYDWAGGERVSYMKKDAYIENGATWILTGELSLVGFNALKQNGIKILPMCVKQYIGGEWVEKEAKSYINGEWVSWWKGQLYDPGIEYTAITGGWIDDEPIGLQSNYPNKSKLEITEDEFGVTMHQPVHMAGMFYMANKIDLTNYSRLYCDGKQSSNTYNVLGIWSRFGNYKNDNLVAYISNTFDGVVSIDVSALSGGYYIGFFVYGQDATTVMRRMWLE